ncbi:MAG: DUF4932 domain-containing protein [Chitinophagaceae bacterium]
MKQTPLLIAFLFTFLHDYAQTLIPPAVDKRIEMMSMVARLSEYEEYSSKDAAEYVNAIHSWFDKYKTDTLIGFAQRVREESSIGFDAVMSMAINLKFVKDKFTLQPNWKTDLDKRWKPEQAAHLLTLLNQFYTRTNAAGFFAQEEPYYQKVIAAFGQVLTNFNQSWYFDYYGVKPKDKFTIVIGCGNGGGNYGPGISLDKNTREVYAIMGSWSFDDKGNPVFKEANYLPTVVHEFNHSFINPLLNRYDTSVVLKTSMQKILDTMRSEMQRQAYGDWKTVINESLVRASVVRYLSFNNPTNPKIAEDELSIQINRGFLWTKDLVALLGTYEANRKKYPTINEFYPVIISFFKSVADSISYSKAIYESNLPRVASLEPFSNNAQDVDPSITELTINFDQVLTGKGYSINLGKLGNDGFPIKSVIGYANNNQSLKVKVELKPDTEYEFVLTGRSFKNTGGYPLKDYTIKFRTKK